MEFLEIATIMIVNMHAMNARVYDYDVILAHHKKELMMVQELQRHMKDPVILLVE